MAPRRYDDDEIRRIFDEASREPSRLPAARGGGFTLAELQEIGAEAGLDPAHVAAAARALDAPSGALLATRRRVMGLPLGVSRTVELPGAFDEHDWNRLVVDLRETFDAPGRLRVDGAFREWRNGNLVAMVEPHGDGHRLRLRTVKGSARRMFFVGGVSLAMALFLLVVFVVTGELSEVADAWVGPAVMAFMGAVFAGGAAVQLPSWASLRAEQMEGVAARAMLRAGGDEGAGPDPGRRP